MTCENGAALVTLKGKGDGARPGASLRDTHVLEEDLEDTTGLFIDETRDTLHTTTTSETTDSLWLVTMVVSPLPLSQTKTTSDDVRAW